MSTMSLKLEVDGETKDFFATRHDDGRVFTQDSKFMIKENEIDTVWVKSVCTYKYHSKIPQDDVAQVMEFMKFAKAPTWTTE